MLAGAEDAVAQSNAQAQAASADISAEASEAAPFLTQRLKRRYIPRFIGKRKQDATEINIDKIVSGEAESDTEDDFTDLDDSELIDLFNKLSDTAIIDDETSIDDEDDTEDINSGEYLDDENDTFDETVDIERRYIPSFVGKRYNPMFVGKRYNPMFVGKRYNPMFVGKRYVPRFVGKRYVPRFIGKRYRPMFVGKRRSPMFVGKRYNPMFVGKRYNPMFVGKKATTIPRFIGKKATTSPMFVGKRRVPMFLGKRSISAEEEAEAVKTDNSQEELHSRKKRSLMAEPDTDLKRAWGTYVPWQDIPTYRMLQTAGPAIDKRFVAPEFIGRRDSLSSLLSALKALRYARNEPRIASKRFQAPLFIGKRDSASEDAMLKYYRLSPLEDGNYELITALQELSGKLD